MLEWAIFAFPRTLKPREALAPFAPLALRDEEAILEGWKGLAPFLQVEDDARGGEHPGLARSP